MKALIFDVDGTLADTEKFGHLPACNAAMRILNLNIQWSWKEFIKLIHQIPGNANRLAFTLKAKNIPSDEIRSIVNEFIKLKQEIYIDRYLPQIKLRPGIEKLLTQANKAGAVFAIVSTSHESQIRALLEKQLAKFKENFQVVMGKESGQKTENEGFLHKKCLNKLNISSNQALMIEDSQAGLEAALYSGLPTAVFYNDYSFGNAFSGARLVAPSVQFFSFQMLKKICFHQ